MARSPNPGNKPADAALRQAFRKIESQPVPDALLKQIEALAPGKTGRRTQ